MQIKITQFLLIIAIIFGYCCYSQEKENKKVDINSSPLDSANFNSLLTYFPLITLKKQIHFDSLIKLGSSMQNPSKLKIPNYLFKKYLCQYLNFNCETDNHGNEFDYWGIAKIKLDNGFLLIYERGTGPNIRAFATFYTENGNSVSTLLVKQWNYMDQIHVNAIFKEDAIFIFQTEYNSNGKMEMKYDSTYVCRSIRTYRLKSGEGLKEVENKQSCNFEFDSLGINDN